MNFGEAIISGYRKFFDFAGRSSRSEFWFWVLFTLVANLGLVTVLLIVTQLDGMGLALGTTGALASIFALVFLMPGLAAGVRRQHDIDRSGWSLLIGLIPLVGTVFLISWLATAGDGGANKYGRNPLVRGLTPQGAKKPRVPMSVD